MLLNKYRRLVPYFPRIGPTWLQRKIVEAVPHEGVQRMKDFIDGMHNQAVAIYREKLEALARGDEAVSKQVGEGKDIMSILSK